MIAQNIKPIISSIGKTQKKLRDDGLTYNEAGKTYNEAGVVYGGIYGTDGPQAKMKVENTRP